MNAQELLDSTRKLNLGAALLLSLQFYGNLYEENGAIRLVIDPKPGELVRPLEPGSPLYFYVPWVPAGLALSAALAWRTRHVPFPTVRRDLKVALGCFAVAATAKTVLIVTINDQFRDPAVPKTELVRLGRRWLAGNGVSVVATGAGLVLLLGWRARITTGPTSRR